MVEIVFPVVICEGSLIIRKTRTFIGGFLKGIVQRILKWESRCAYVYHVRVAYVHRKVLANFLQHVSCSCALFLENQIFILSFSNHPLHNLAKNFQIAHLAPIMKYLTREVHFFLVEREEWQTIQKYCRHWPKCYQKLFQQTKNFPRDFRAK